MASTLALVALTVIATLVRSGLIATQNQEATAHLVPIEANAETLVYLQVAWRHGDRTPASPVPFSPASSWDEGLGELTRKGIAQQYRLGKWLRARYGRWLGNRFDRSEVFVRSSDYNRTIMSAQANMAGKKMTSSIALGLFPPTKSEMWDDVLPWQPVPVHTVPRAMDKELYEDISCPTANAEFSTLWRSEVVTRMETENRGFIEFLKEKSGIPNFEFRQLWMVFDNLFCMLQHNDTHKWPSWVNASVFDRIYKLYDASSRLKYHTDLLRRLRGGPLLKEIIERFEAKVNGRLGDKPKLYAY
ncbi:Lysosomal acid phosphatase, partial [Trichostrongylus colubriformis]